MALNWNEIKDRAIQFSKEWENTHNEEADAKPFLDAFFNVFGVDRKRVATFEHRVKKLNEADGYIDLLWKGVILIEMKSKGKNLDKAFEQAKAYVHGLKDFELPKYILVSDFETFRLFDTEESKTIEFQLHDFYKHISSFNLLAGYIKREYKEQDPVNIKAAELMGKLHDQLKDIGYNGHALEVYLVRILFCLFAEDTTIFQKQQFEFFIKERTNSDGSDLASKLQELFQVLNTPNDKRFKNIDEQLSEFPYVNGKLFEETLPIASFNKAMREALLNCCYLDWSKISPAIFGSMFQSVMNPKERRDLGAHYTSEKNILKLIQPLFLDELKQEFKTIKNNNSKLKEFHHKLSLLKFLDPACGCGNFLIITYRELRLLELEVLEAIQKGQQVVDLKELILLNVDQFYGIEYEEFPARIAEVAMYLMDHQMNMAFSIKFGEPFVRLPLQKSATIVHGNALKINWQDLLMVKNNNYDFITNELVYSVSEPVVHYESMKVQAQTVIKEKSSSKNQPNNKTFDYIIGNPPFIGSKMMTQQARAEVVTEFNNIKGAGVLDYVCGWYIKAAKLIHGTKSKAAFVSTNSIVQGEQTAILWGQLLNKYGITIHFAHRTFKWNNEAKGNANVYCVIIGFANYDSNNKLIYSYEDIKGEPKELKVKNINPYLVEAKNIFIEKRRTPVCNVPEISFGSMPNDGGFLLLDEEEKNELIKSESYSKKFIKPFLSAQEFLNAKKKYCLWLVDLKPKELDEMPSIDKRIKSIEKNRKDSTREATRKLALFPALFGEIRQPETNYILIPRVSSELRSVIPMQMFTSNEIIGDTCLAIPNANLFHLGVLQSAMHMAWVKNICGRLKSDYRYSNEIVYNNYPWPQELSQKQQDNIEKAMQKVLDARLQYADTSLADLYSPTKMPAILVKAHLELDKVVDAAYRKTPFENETTRMEFLFELYEKYTADLFTKGKKK